MPSETGPSGTHPLNCPAWINQWLMGPRHTVLDEHLLDGDCFKRVSLESSATLELSIQNRYCQELPGKGSSDVYRFPRPGK